ncbi:MAG: ribulose-phosphate 3-epimerase [Bacteriovoracaceae bacterium]|nr:ribulose-phosphate 3-epimerase [Bacteriovoracaceae bacterium]
MNDTIISPSILSCDFLNIETELKYFEKIPNLWIHLDVMDGHFVPNLTFGHPIIQKISKVTNHLLDAHLMVSNPEFYIKTFSNYNIHNITFHLEATSNAQEALKIIEQMKSSYASVGISIKPGTPVSAISDDIFKRIDLLLVMSVEPGFGGQSFIETTYDKLNQIKDVKKRLNLKFDVQVDGGVTDENAKKLIEHGVSNLVAGSYIFKNSPKKYQSIVEKLRN